MPDGSSRSYGGTTLASWAWFGSWAAVGAGWGVGLVGLLIFVLPVAAVATCLLAAGRRSWTGFAGVISGVGAPLLYVAYLHRQGPGYVCTASSVAQTCTQELSPWPWLVVGLVLVAAGVTVFLARRIPSRAPVP